MGKNDYALVYIGSLLTWFLGLSFMIVMTGLNFSDIPLSLLVFFGCLFLFGAIIFYIQLFGGPEYE
jgi:hypothetical protein